MLDWGETEESWGKLRKRLRWNEEWRKFEKKITNFGDDFFKMG